MNVTSIFKASLLAQMAYADNLNNNKSGSLLSNALIHPDTGVDNVTQAQADYFSANYRVIYQEPTTQNSGFSATLFQEISSEKYIFSLRGTDGVGPDWTDANLDNVLRGVSRNQVVDMLNFYLRLTHSGDVKQYKYEEIALDINLPPPNQPYISLGSKPVGQGLTNNIYGVLSENGTIGGLDLINNTEQLTVTGHSLGGHLASAFTLLFPNVSQATYTFNSAGFIGWASNEFDTFAHLLKISVTDIAINPQSLITGLSSVTDISASLDYVSNLPNQNHLGTRTTIDVENVTVAEVGAIDYIVDNHSIDLISDSLAVINLLHTLDDTITIESANQIIARATNKENTSLEGVIRSLAKLFGQTEIPLVDSDHDALYTVISNIQNVAGSYVGSFVIQSVGSLAEYATIDNAQGQAYRYALVNLNPFAITSDANLYAQHNGNGELNIEHFSEQYLQDRAQMLGVKNQFFAEDKLSEFNSPAGDILYSDLVTGLDLRQTKGLSTNDVDRTQIIFGSANDETGSQLNGGRKNDHIYGGRGNDILRGMADDDYLEGNQGDDTLYGGEGSDILIGGIGNDSLYGGASDKYADILDGGKDDDTYYITSNDGDTIIRDSDQIGKVIVDGNPLGAGIKALTTGGNIYEDDDKKINLSLFSLEGLFADFVTDIDLAPSGLARKQVASMVNWWLKNIMVMQEAA